MESTKRLLVTGDKSVLHGMTDQLFGEGFEAVFCDKGAAALEYVNKHGLPHMAIILADLPDMDGISLCQQFHSLADLPIIVLAKSDPPGQAASALQHADDYVRLPVEDDELVMRIRRILSRIDNFSYARGPLLEVCDSLQIDYVQRQVIVDGNIRQLTPTENALLNVLLKHWGEVVDADTLIERVWRTGASIHDRNSLRVHVHRLRSKIEHDPDDPKIILTERGIGYIFSGC